MPPKDPSSDNSGQLFTLPVESAAPEVGTLPAHQPRIKNLAGDEELVKKVRKVMQDFFAKFSDDSMRDDLESGLKEADNMYRLSATRPTGKRAMNTTTNVRDSGFNEIVDAVHANEVSVLLQDGELPARYEVDEDAVGEDQDFSSDEEAKAIATARQHLAMHTWEKDGRTEKLRNVNWRLNKNGNTVVSDQWDRCIETRKVRVVTGRDAEGIPTGFRFDSVEVVTKDCPCFVEHDMRNIYFDLSVDDMQKTSVIEHGPKPLDFLWGSQKQGQIMNVGKIKRQHLFTDEDDNSNILQDRYDNADEDDPLEVTNGDVDIWHGWIKLPINDKGEWDADNTLPHWHWMTFAGKVRDANSVCLRLVANPYNHRRNPYLLLHSHRDEKGAVHMGLATKLRGLNWESIINLNQAIESKDLRNRAPFVLTGQVLSGDLTFTSPNKLIKLAFGSSLKREEMPDTTGTTMQFDERIRDRMNALAGTRKPFLGEALGGRTSATESKNVFDQAVKPGLEKVNYFAEQLLPWLWWMDAMLWDQYGDPNRKLRILGSMVDPTQIWGPIKAKVSVIGEFANNSLVRQQLSAFIANDYPMAKEEMTPEGKKIFWRNVWRVLGLQHGDVVFGTSDIGDALKLAREESYAMMETGQAIEPEPNQQHGVHISVHEAIADEFALAAKAEKSQQTEIIKANLPVLRQHILLQKQMAEDTAASQAQQISQVPGNESGMVGQGTGDLIEGQEGANARF